MKIDEKKLDYIIKFAASKNTRKVLDTLNDGQALTFSELKLLYNTTADTTSNAFSHYVRKSKQYGLLRIDEKTRLYYLTRLGVRTLELINEYRKLCMSYDLSDCGLDGRPMIQIMGRKI